MGARIVGLIGMFMRGKHLGRLAGADASYQCFPSDPSKVRKPDVSFIRAGRLPGNQAPRGHCPVAPDLAVEVLSPNDLAEEVDAKVAEYMAVGVPLVRVVHPAVRTVRVHRAAANGGGVVLVEADTITGEDVIPGFSCAVREFFEEL